MSVIVLMGSGAETADQTARALQAQGERVGVLNVRLFRPFSGAHFVRALPPTTRVIAVLDRTKEPGSGGEPLYLDVVAALAEATTDDEQHFAVPPRVVGGRYGLSSKEFTPAMVKAIYDELGKPAPKNHFTIGIDDDVSHTSLSYDPAFSIEDDDTVRCVFWGLGSDGTVGANKDTIKIIGDEGERYAQGYFVYDSKKSGSVTISHLRFGPRPIRAPYLIAEAGFVACHQFALLERYDVLKYARPGAVFLLNSPHGPDTVWEHLPSPVQEAIRTKHLTFYVIDASGVAQAAGMTGRINRIMQTCFFALGSGMPREQAIFQIKHSIEQTYGKRGAAVVQQNLAAVDQALSHLFQVNVDAVALSAGSVFRHRWSVPDDAPGFVRDVLGPMIVGDGDQVPVSALPLDGTFPTGTACWEKRNIGAEIPVWDPELCIQCGKCVMVCPHAVIRHKVYDPALLADQPEQFKSVPARFKEFPDMQYTLQVAPEDCTGCSLCVEACPVKDKRQVGRKAINMMPQPPLREQEKTNWNFFLSLPDIERSRVDPHSIKNSQLFIPLFEFSGACAGCGETPYVKLVSQLFGDRALVANATGCSSIYGGNLPTTPWTVNREGRGPAWANSLFEDNAEFGLGMRLTLDKQQEYARELLQYLRDAVGGDLVDALLHADQSNEAGIDAQRARVAHLKSVLEHSDEPRARDLLSLADTLVRRSVWIIGGDGWAYDIGFGGLDHVLASGRNVNVLVLDTEVYSNTGGQASKSTPRGAVAKFAAAGKGTPKKDLGLIAMAYNYVYVARVAMGANDQQTLNAFLEADAYDGPSLIIAYSHCIAHGIDMRKGLEQQKRAVQSGHWSLFRYHPALVAEGKSPLIIDSKEPTIPLEQYLYNETRYRMLQQTDHERADALLQEEERDITTRLHRYRALVDPAIKEQ
jgi:pyruvate-ferredoxin/flavodoxin oxidoreductase